MDWDDHLVPGKTESSCKEQGNRWENGECKEVSVYDYCTIEKKTLDLPNMVSIASNRSYQQHMKSLVLGACFEHFTLPEYKINQQLKYGIYGDEDSRLLRYQPLKPYQRGRAIELIGKMERDSRDGMRMWRRASHDISTNQHAGFDGLTEYYDLAVENIDMDVYFEGKRRGTISEKQVDKAIELENTRHILRHCTKEKQVMALIDNGHMERELDLGPINERLEDVGFTTRALEYAAQRGVRGHHLSWVHLPPSAIDEAMRLDKRFDEVYSRLEGADRDEWVGLQLDYALYNKLPDEVLKEMTRSVAKYDLLYQVYEYQKLTPAQVQRGIELGYHIPTLLAYQKLSKTQVEGLIDGLDYSTNHGKALFNSLWTNTGLSSENRKKLAEKGGLKDVVSEHAHFVWSGIHPENVPEVMERLNKAIVGRGEDNPLKPITGDYPMEVK